MAFTNDPSKPWTWDAQMTVDELNKKSEEIRRFCDWDDSRQSFSTDGDGSTYNFENRYRGLAFILNNEKFILDSKGGSIDREGSAVDKENLVLSLKKWGFHVIVFDNLTASQLKKAAKVAAKNYKHQEADCFVCVILSHGEEESRDGGIHHVIAGSDRETVSTHDIIKTFDTNITKELENKPKLFFIQACRGYRFDDGVMCSETSEVDQNQTSSSGSTSTVDAEFAGVPTENNDTPKAGELGTNLKMKNTVNAVPLYQDCLIMYGTPPGYYSWKSPLLGSWFIQELCKFLQSDDKVEAVSFLRGLMYVSDKVATEHESYTKRWESDSNPDVLKSHEKRAMPVIDTMLTKDICLKKKIIGTGAHSA